MLVFAVPCGVQFIQWRQIPIDESEIAQPDSPSLRPLANVTTAKTSGTSSAVVSEDAKSSASSAEELDEDGGSPDKDSEILECPESHDGMTQYLDKSFAMDIDHLFTCIFTGMLLRYCILDYMWQKHCLESAA